jgi:formate dehydrogenase iron-sulfur subunit
MTMRLFIPRDAGALAVGADEVAAAIQVAAMARGVAVEIVRTGSRGLYWLEPLVELETPEGRIGYGSMEPQEADGLLAARLGDGAHEKRVGRPEEIPFLARQTRVTMARCGIVDPRSLDDYRAHGGLAGLEKAIALGPQATVETVTQSGLRGRGGAGFPTGV